MKFRRETEPSLSTEKVGPSSPSDTYGQIQRVPRTYNKCGSTAKTVGINPQEPPSNVVICYERGLKEVCHSFTPPLVTEEGKRAALISRSVHRHARTVSGGKNTLELANIYKEQNNFAMGKK